MGGSRWGETWTASRGAPTMRTQSRGGGAEGPGLEVEGVDERQWCSFLSP